MAKAKPRRSRWGSVRVQRSGRFQARATIRGQMRPLGTFDSEKDAWDYLDAVRWDMTRGLYSDPTAGQRITLAEWAPRVIAAHCASLTPKTRQSYDSLWGSCIVDQLGHFTLSEIGPLVVSEWLAEISALSSSRKTQAKNMLGWILQAAVAERILMANPVVGVRVPKDQPREPRILTPRQVFALVDAMPTEVGQMLILVLAWSGARVGEALELRRHDLNLTTGLLRIERGVTEVNGRHHVGDTKGHQVRYVRLPAPLIVQLRSYVKEHAAPGTTGLLFPSQAGTHLMRKRLDEWWRKAKTAARAADSSIPEDVQRKDLRASVADWIAAEGSGLLDASARLGHGDAMVTRAHYARGRRSENPVVGEDLARLWREGRKPMKAKPRRSA